MARVLVVDDVHDTTDSLVRSLKKVGCDVAPAYSETEALQLLRQSAFDVVVTDMMMEKPDSGLQVLKEAKKLDPYVEVIILTAYGEVRTAVPAMKLGAFDYVEKTTEDYDERDVYDIITALVERCIDSRQVEAMYQVIFGSQLQLALPREVEIYRSRKSDYEVFVDDEYGMVYVAGQEVDIHDLPYQILVYLMENRGALRSPIRLYLDVWDDPDGWVLAERNPKVLQNRVKARVSNLRGKLNLPSIRILYRNERYGLSVPDGVDYCLIKEFRSGGAREPNTRQFRNP
jgi:DNA-binding response OmpR family regulator